MAIAFTPLKEGVLREAFVDLQSYSSSLTNFTCKWKDLEEHLSSIADLIEKRFSELNGKETTSAPEKLDKALEEQKTVEARSELKSLCARMDIKGLRNFMEENRKDITSIISELGPALRLAPDPIELVLNSLDGFFSLKGEKSVTVLSIRKTSVNLLEGLLRLAPEVKPSARERALRVTMEWKQKIDAGDAADWLEALGFLQLVAVFGLVGSYAVDDILDLLVLVVRRKSTIDLCRRLGLEDKMSDLVDKLRSNGKLLDAVKFAIAFDLTGKHHPSSVLKTYVMDSRKAVREARKKGTPQSPTSADAKEMSSLKTVIRTVERLQLGSIFKCERLQKRIVQLEKQTAEKKRNAATSANATSANSNAKGQNVRHQEPNKRPRLSSADAPVAAVPTLTAMQPQLALVERAPYIDRPGSYTLAAAPPQSSASMSSYFAELAGLHAPSKTYLYSPESMLGTGYYNRPTPFGGHSVPGQSAYYRL